ncbi:unnamed protein product [marine sediment metagenome]|uniref:DUF4064 domain-containing protein n=1 Tax=marine sediment metagenome TaxID=412755 RepID=X1CIG8_9ZZZZ
MTKHYKNEGIMKVLTILGALVGLATIILGIAKIENYAIINPFLGAAYAIINIIVGIVICVLTLLVGLKPNKPLPFHWLVLLILAILLVAFGAGIWACVLVLIAAIIGLIEDLS